MSRSFLKPEVLEEMRATFVPPAFAFDGAFHEKDEWPATAFSRSLLDRLLEEWRRDPDFEAAGAVLVGSGAREELAPRSDLDLLFAGDETSAGAFTRRQQEKGVRIRARVPESRDDWSLGVEIPDLLAILDAKSLSTVADEPLARQKERILRLARQRRRAWLKHLLTERNEREERFDSIANVLEPNLKYGPGGLRDLDQARQILRLFPERFENVRHARAILETHAAWWTTLRQKLHLEGQGDLLSSAAQFDLARWMSMQHKDFMREVQRGLSRVHFYARWIFERARASERRWQSLEKTRVASRAGALQLLERDSSVLGQQRVRKDLDRLFPRSWSRGARPERGRLLWRVLRPGQDEAVLGAVFECRLMDKLCPEIRPLVGLVQHDQYHRYTADVHLLQACRHWQRVLKKPRRLGPLAAEIRRLTAQDRRVLSWAVLYHDLMKGREGDHSQLGRKLVWRELGGFGESESVIADVEWIVEHHLELSQAAFRRNPRAPTTWSRLEAIGAVGSRLRKLAVFTAIDIQATNPEAWTPWKARLIADLLNVLRSPGTKDYLALERELARRNGPAELAASIDGFLMARVPARILAEDLAEAAGGASLAPRVVARPNGAIWVRFHDVVDRPGLFADFAQRLYSLGIGIRHASVSTLKGVGVYDWFEVSGRRSVAQIRVFLQSTSVETARKAPPAVRFESVSFVSQDKAEWVISFKGLDQSGCLVAAARALADEGLSIVSARVQTWGRQIDDLFHVHPQGDPEALLKKLRARLVAAE